MFGMAARGLGVHESTLRRWEARGLMPTEDLPGRALRFGPEEHEALGPQVSRDFPPIVEVDLPLVSVDRVDG